ncbi:two-component regulator [Campylobacter hyointestinalis subsp. hyointestinalis]|uniref:Two-component regulator n=1 Tax=Campylobacter hyointestinalis subsp. hyointestinalis TaxID=91352 RepID=A0A0S4RM46_CAMHY|nr:hypothetical protein [Campylobacter hyointestinalis]PPB52047.1 hypothetical protein CDQ68_04375 [Campylobacter hyointestinalis subsp. hyointestinalis]CUU71484.1 two-component regulator [Campylobacter hyointestinalis subsp. hyointestinalis]CUU74305.1 two-component regulator [Campylobacter hyointestinalis subsp. hyointestinalis]CUU74323.1 two-component regulator [Campylobacter hyointestinalis subsp. hyointestinalis]CUU87324.1 two-component regulator [Campylobacter hyointestinalis subsp. hyoin
MLFRNLILFTFIVLSLHSKEIINLEIKKSNKIYNFEENINIIGKWKITSGKYYTYFLNGSGNRWEIEFKKDGYIYDIDKKALNLKWKDIGNGFIKITYPINNKSNFSIINDTIKIKNRKNDSCFIVESDKHDIDFEMCKTSGSLWINPKQHIKIYIR